MSLAAICFATTSSLGAPETAEKDANVFGYRLNYRETGRDRPSYCFLHGLGGDGSRWTSATAALASDLGASDARRR